MRNNQVRVGLVTLAACTVLGWWPSVKAQTTNGGSTNGVYRWTAEDNKRLEREAEAALARSTNVHQHLSKEDMEWAAKVAASYSPRPWPDAAQKQTTLRRCAAVLRSAIDTNEIELACRQMTNQPEAVVALKNFTAAAASNLDACAAALASPSLRTDIGEIGYLAELWGSSNYFFFTFWTTNRLPTMIRSLDQRTPDGGRVTMVARFYESGKLQTLDTFFHDGTGVVNGSEGFSFKQNGKLDRHWREPE